MCISRIGTEAKLLPELPFNLYRHISYHDMIDSGSQADVTALLTEMVPERILVGYVKCVVGTVVYAYG